ncbi:MAG TPA: hypothetical protein VJV78_39600 [Polyangiales bacterium]|nr:hypothetical protein [Polyangiales bacterium]
MIHALWLGQPLAIRSEVLSNDPDADVISPNGPNTSPHLSAEAD